MMIRRVDAWLQLLLVWLHLLSKPHQLEHSMHAQMGDTAELRVSLCVTTNSSHR